MDLLKRCPGCQLVPVFYLDDRNLWQGGCQSQKTLICSALTKSVLQPTLEQAQAQWHEVIKAFEVIAKV